MDANTSTMKTARDAYFVANNFGPDGGYDEPWIDISFGPIPLGFPNFESRKQAVAYHDLHHILTGYQTDYPGEIEIAAWEIGAGCKTSVAAWVLNLLAIAGGVLAMPRRTYVAFKRGLRSQSLYGESLPELLDLSVDAVRARQHIPSGEVPSQPGDAPRFAAAAVAGTVLGAIALPTIGLPFVLVGFLYRWAKQ